MNCLNLVARSVLGQVADICANDKPDGLGEKTQIASDESAVKW